MLTMTRGQKLIQAVARESLRFVISWLLGILGGGLCGAVLATVFCLLEGDSTPVEGFSSPYVYSAVLGLIFGAIVGAIVTPPAYPLHIRKIGGGKAFRVATIWTLAGGLLGMLCPLLIVPLSIFSFFAALVCTADASRHPAGMA
jgi:hypothetical protein